MAKETKKFSPRKAMEITSTFVNQMVDSQYLYGYLGEPNGAGGFIYKSRTRPGYIRVRLTTNDSTYSVVDAVNTTVALRSDIRVRLTREPRSGVYRVVDIDPLFVIQELTTLGSGLGVGPHSHRRGFGLAEYLEPELFEAGALQVYDGSFTITLLPFFYDDSYYAGGTLDLTSAVPSTAYKWRWAKVLFDTTSGLPSVSAGTTEFDSMEDMTTTTLTEIDNAGKLPIMGVRLGQAETGIEDAIMFEDIKTWLGSAPTTSVLNNFTATSAPTSGDDNLDGYEVGSLWVDVTGDAGYLCVDASTGAAIWLDVSAFIPVDSDDLFNVSGVTGSTVSDALDQLATLIAGASGGSTVKLWLQDTSFTLSDTYDDVFWDAEVITDAAYWDSGDPDIILVDDATKDYIFEFSFDVHTSTADVFFLYIESFDSGDTPKNSYISSFRVLYSGSGTDYSTVSPAPIVIRASDLATGDYFKIHLKSTDGYPILDKSNMKVHEVTAT